MKRAILIFRLLREGLGRKTFCFSQSSGCVRVVAVRKNYFVQGRSSKSFKYLKLLLTRHYAAFRDFFTNFLGGS